MIAESKGLFERAGKRLEAAEVVDPLVLGEAAQPKASRPAVVAVAQDVLGEDRGCDRIVECVAELGVLRGGLELHLAQRRNTPTISTWVE